MKPTDSRPIEQRALAAYQNRVNKQNNQVIEASNRILSLLSDEFPELTYNEQSNLFELGNHKFYGYLGKCSIIPSNPGDSVTLKKTFNTKGAYLVRVDDNYMSNPISTLEDFGGYLCHKWKT